MKASAFDKKFDAGEDITNPLDLSRARKFCGGQNFKGQDLI